MSKILLLRIFSDNETVKGLYSDGLNIEELKAITTWCQDRISEINSMKPKGDK